MFATAPLSIYFIIYYKNIICIYIYCIAAVVYILYTGLGIVREFIHICVYRGGGGDPQGYQS